MPPGHAWRDPGAVGAPVQPWARAAAWACLLLPMPSVIWRVAMLLGADVGFADADAFRGDPGLTAYVLGLDVTEVAVGVLCLGLIMRWGEVVPRWVPGLGGRVIHRLVPTVIGGVGNVTLYAIMAGLAAAFVPVWLGQRAGWTPDRGMDSGQRAVLLVCYVPFFLWPVAITPALVGYWRRRSA
ncbi:hypothetical protein [Nigerium massiliense]|uniref:hypothetical protein n=1 Tax=Nigerium massiliense TaxID=1522317 RepID=UPI000693412E|nr:hypothetical protein [Nigerium massiliense]